MTDNQLAQDPEPHDRLRISAVQSASKLNLLENVELPSFTRAWIPWDRRERAMESLER